HTSAVGRHLVPQKVTADQIRYVYASEADMLNVALFGMTARQWREANPDLDGNIRDYASINELICLSNMESLNSVLIEEGLPQSDRLVRLNEMAIRQMEILSGTGNRNLLK
ncbi:MAG: KilA-N domain-containing protein, partial [Bacteroidales bacterium]|nr:KilA-N domain-containing protein [Bacteroidales bacterium]